MRLNDTCVVCLALHEDSFGLNLSVTMDIISWGTMDNWISRIQKRRCGSFSEHYDWDIYIIVTYEQLYYEIYIMSTVGS